ncbi:hypothetical protein SFRURICE_001503 [Spodoptera frugiperda]|nr:hypothetical protein SFRURICE_001503 [Spodoptera frugiperda]
MTTDGVFYGMCTSTYPFGDKRRDVHDARDIGRQRCTLQHVMPLYNAHPVFTICVTRGEPNCALGEYWGQFQTPCYHCKILEKPKKSPVIIYSTGQLNPRPLFLRTKIIHMIRQPLGEEWKVGRGDYQMTHPSFRENLHTLRHVFYPRRGRQRCTLWHTPCHTSEKFSKIGRGPVIFCPTRQSNPVPLVQQSHLRSLDQRSRQRIRSEIL